MWELMRLRSATHCVLWSGIEQTMPDQPPTGRRFQFGLRKLLLWTAVVAMFLGLLGMIEVALSTLLILTSWATIVGVARAIFNTEVAGLMSVAIGVVLGVWLTFLVSPFSVGVFSYAVYAMMFGLFGLFVCVFVEVAFRAVDWLDNLIRTKTGD